MADAGKGMPSVAFRGGAIGIVLALPLFIFGPSGAEHYHKGVTWKDLGQVAMYVPAPGGGGRGVWLGLLLNGVIWAASAAVLLSRNPHWSAKVAKGITCVLWALWLIFAWFTGTAESF